MAKSNRDLKRFCKHKKGKRYKNNVEAIPTHLPFVFPLMFPAKSPRTKAEKRKAVNDALFAGLLAFATSLPMSMWPEAGKELRKKKNARK